MRSPRQKALILLFLFVAAASIVAACYSLKTKKRPYVGLDKRWAIGIYSGSSPLRLSPSKNISNPVLTASDVKDVKARYIADPFMIRRDDTWYMFFEVLNAATSQGDIGFASSKDGFAWSYGSIVLDEPFHLSYPYTFQWDGSYYMIPESLEQRSVRIYRAEGFPTEWGFWGTLLTGGDFVDSSLIRHEDRWWLFTATGNQTLRLFHADSLLGSWTEHPCSPVVTDDPRTARPGGRVFKYGEKLFRFAQDDYPFYGKSVSAFEISALTSTKYEEQRATETPTIRGTGTGWNEAGMHHIDPHQLGDAAWIACVDGYRNTFTLEFR